MGAKTEFKTTDLHQQMTTRLSGAVVIHAAAFVVAVFSLGSGAGIGLSAKAESKLARIAKQDVPVVQAIVVGSRGRVRHLSSMPNLKAQDLGPYAQSYVESYEDSVGGTELPPETSVQDEAIVTTQYYSEN